MSLPHCDPLFTKFLAPWYSSGEKNRKQFDATRPDILTIKECIGVPVSELGILSSEGESEVKSRIEIMLNASRGDWPKFLKVSGEIDEIWVAKFDRYYNRKRVAELIARSDPTDFSNDYLVSVCEFGAVLGHVLISKQPRLVWLYDSPYWESSLLDTHTGSIIPPFHWAIKKLSGYGVDDGFTEKIEMCLQMLE